jgi:hypothetical protein
MSRLSRRGVVNVGREDHDLAPSRSALFNAGALTRSAGVPVLFREVAITGIGQGLPAALAMVRAQNPPYLPAHAAVVGQTGLSIEFAAPSPPGLLSPVLDADSPRPAAAGGGIPLGVAQIR